jgi:lipopolysaccharide transport system permease protein
MASINFDITVIRPAHGWMPLDLRELWAYRDLCYFLAWRRIKVRYKQAALGAAWAVLQPALTMIIFSVIFGRFARLPSDGLPYPIFVLAALLPWQLFASALAESGTSVVANSNLVTKVYFPRLVLPIAAVLAGLVDFAVSFLLLIALMAYYGIVPTAGIVWLPAYILLTILTALAAGLWLSALNVRYRDVQYTIPFIVQFWLFASPIAYSASLIPERWRLLYSLNPMVGVIEGFRGALLGGEAVNHAMVGTSALAVGVVLIGGLFFFRRMEKTFADLV